MKNSPRETITVQTKVNAPIKKVCSYWIAPKQITMWNFAS